MIEILDGYGIAGRDASTDTFEPHPSSDRLGRVVRGMLVIYLSPVILIVLAAGAILVLATRLGSLSGRVTRKGLDVATTIESRPLHRGCRAEPGMFRMRGPRIRPMGIKGWARRHGA